MDLIPEVNSKPENVKWITPDFGQFPRSIVLINENNVLVYYDDGEGHPTLPKTRQPCYTLSSISTKIYTENPIMRARSILGYWDIVFMRFGLLKTQPYEDPSPSGALTFRSGNIRIHSGIFIEVKPKIDSFGKVMRQLKTYETYQPEAKGNIYLVTPDLRFKDAFESQGIHVISPNGGASE